MKVILLEKNRNLGNIGEVVNVKPGFGRNYLIPQKKAKAATAANIAEFEKQRVVFEQLAQEKVAAAEARAHQLTGKQLTVTAKTGEEGRLFGSIGTSDIAKAIGAQLGVDIARSEVKMPHGPVRQTGEYAIDIQLHGDVTATLAVFVVAEI